MEEIIDEIAHVNVSISTVQYTLTFFDISLWTVLTNVPAPVFVLLLAHTIQQKAFAIPDVFFLELFYQLVLALKQFESLVLGALFVMVFKEDDIAVTISFGGNMTRSRRTHR